MHTISYMKALFEKWKARKKNQPLKVEITEPEEWLGGEAMISPEILKERKLKQKRKRL